MSKVINRFMDTVGYDVRRIETAVRDALSATGEYPVTEAVEQARRVAGAVTGTLAQKYGSEDFTTDIEEIQNIVEETLMRVGLFQTAKAYILYRKQHENLRDMAGGRLDVKKSIEGFIGPFKDWRVKENATVSCTLGGLILSNSATMTAHYWLNEIYDPEIAEAHRSAALHIHDLSMLSGYCAGWSLRQLIQEGLGGVEGRISSSPALHLSTLCNQMVNFLGILQNEWAGAQAFSSFDTYLAPYVRQDALSYPEVKQCIQSFIYGVNTPSRWGTQAPFSNVTMDWTCPEDMKNLPALLGGRDMDFTYGDCQKEMDMINKAFIEIMIEGDANGRGFQYPIPTYSITKDFYWGNTENNRLLFEMAAKYGIPYFSNYIHSDMSPSDVRSMCCRLRLDLRELRRKSGGFFGSGESTGSIGVVTLNLPRLAYTSPDEEAFYAGLDRLMDIAARSLDTKRKIVTSLMENGMYPYTKRYLGSFENHFSTIGLVGMNEAARNARWLRSDLTTPQGQRFAKRILHHMRNRLQNYQEEYHALFNLEATPAESTAYRLAKHDTEMFPDIITAAQPGHTPFYTNSSHLPVGFTEDVFEALELQDELQSLYTSGTVFHAFLGERLPDWRSAATLVRKIAENYSLPYFTLSPTYSVCAEHGYLQGEHQTCPRCGREAEVYSRITGYYRPVRNWNDGKAQEFAQRKEYQPGPASDSETQRDSGIAKRVEASCAKGVCRLPESRQKAGIPNVLALLPGRDFPVLIASSSCPNCLKAKTALDAAGVAVSVVYAEEEPELILQLRVHAVPELLVKQETGEPERIAGLSNILAFISKYHNR